MRDPCVFCSKAINEGINACTKCDTTNAKSHCINCGTVLKPKNIEWSTLNRRLVKSCTFYCDVCQLYWERNTYYSGVSDVLHQKV